MSTALYRRYRPDNFSDLIGQSHVTEPLMAALTKNRVNHAYLFSGPRGCGKTTSARILARCLNCDEGPTPTPCGKCPSCLDLATGGQGSLDVVEIDAASHGGVDDARDLRERATFAPARDRYKIFIIDEAHMVTNQGFNALLKIVEEPPAHLKFIFATTEPDKVIGTIRSRTHHYPFRLVSPEPLQNYLAELLTSESMTAAPGVLSLAIRAGGGSVRDTLSVLDQLIAGSPSTNLEYDRAVDLLGFTHAGLLDDVVDALATQDAATLFRMVDQVVQSGQDPRRFVEDLLERFRDLIIIRAVPENPGQVLRGIPQDVLARMEVQAHNLGPAQLSLAADITNDTLTAMVGATSPQLQLELLMARLLLPAAESTHLSLAARLDRVEQHLSGTDNTSFSPLGSEATTEEPVAQQESAPARSAADVRAMLAKQKEQPVAPAPIQVPQPVAEPAAEPQPTEEPEPTPAAETAPTEIAPDPVPTTAPEPESTPVDAAVDPAPAEEEPAPAAAEASGPNPVELARRLWPEIIQDLAAQSRILWMIAKDHTAVAGFDGTHLVINFGNDGARNTFISRGGEPIIQQLASNRFGTECTIDFISGGGDFPAPKAASAAPSETAAPATDHSLGPEPDWSKPEPPISWDTATNAQTSATPPAPAPEEVPETEDDFSPEKPFGSAPIPSFARPAAEMTESAADSSVEPETHVAPPAQGKPISRFQQMLAAQRAEEQQQQPAPAPASAPVEDSTSFVPSDEDEEVEASSTMGRAALEKVLGAKLIEERRPGQEPPKF